MLAIARGRAADLGREADLRQGDAQALDFPDASFDTVLCALGLCAIPDDRRAVTEMARVLRPGGRLLLVDHVAASASALRAVQWLYERITIPLAGEHFRRRPLAYVRELGFDVEEAERFRFGIVERVCARKPSGDPSSGPAIRQVPDEPHPVLALPVIPRSSRPAAPAPFTDSVAPRVPSCVPGGPPSPRPCPQARWQPVLSDFLP